MCSVLPIPSGNLKHGYRIHRVVILPDYQSLGIGTKLINFIGDYYLSKGYKYYVRSTHLRLRDYWNNSPLYVPTSHNNRKGDLNGTFSNKNYNNERICGSYEYMGNSYLNKHIDIFVDYNSDIDLDIIKQDLEYLKNKNYYITVITGNVNEDNPIDIICQQLGIRTQLLYYRGKISTNNSKHKIIYQWDSKFSESVQNYY